MDECIHFDYARLHFRLEQGAELGVLRGTSTGGMGLRLRASRSLPFRYTI